MKAKMNRIYHKTGVAVVTLLCLFWVLAHAESKRGDEMSAEPFTGQALGISHVEEPDSADMKIVIDGRTYHVVMNRNAMTDDILRMLPLKMTFERYGGHEYHASLPDKPSVEKLKKTCDARAGSLYYFDGWSSLSLFFEDLHTESAHVIHVGDIVEDISAYLKSADEKLEVR